MSQVFVTNYMLFENNKVRFESFIDWIVNDNINILHKVLSNSYKFVFLSLFSHELYVEDLAYWFHVMVCTMFQIYTR